MRKSAASRPAEISGPSLVVMAAAKPRAETALPRPERRMLSRAEAADYVGMSVGSFMKLVDLRHMPQPKRFPVIDRVAWCRKELDRSIDMLPSDGHDCVAANDVCSPFDDLQL